MDNKLLLYSVSDRYIRYLRADPRLSIVFDNKENARSHTRKYLGIVITRNSYNYFVPFSSPKDSDYIIAANGGRVIRRSIIPIIRIITTDTLTGTTELKGTLKVSNMIPVPTEELLPYNIGSEMDSNYKIIVEKEYEFIRKNASQIIKNADVIYNQKTKEHDLYPDASKKPRYLDNTVQFKYAEEKCLEYCKLHHLHSAVQEKQSATDQPKLSIADRIKEAEKIVAQREAERRKDPQLPPPRQSGPKR